MESEILSQLKIRINFSRHTALPNLKIGDKTHDKNICSSAVRLKLVECPNIYRSRDATFGFSQAFGFCCVYVYQSIRQSLT